MQISDKAICRLLLEHNSNGMELMFKCYYRPLVLWADTYLNDIAASEDLVQDFFLSFWENSIYERITSSNFRGYIFVSVKNRALKLLEKRDPLRDAITLLPLGLEDYQPDNITEEMLQAIEAEIRNLPPRMREVLTSVYIEGLSYRETSEKLKISISTVKTLLVNALKRLREKFYNYIKTFC
ncbi:sigma-70 family RNA polymerase sigma factor [uncultured Bacteroides sp.]|uniref:sigma-70 family RNA polymerase sigma factor n=1 Tax=uncultured Bacteroides sp. TaxID=162156 RepID=UPI002AAA9A2F|nr:sigma-70 family RNA polymerase sigma factor [uncultured Bacteroides sp.]